MQTVKAFLLGAALALGVAIAGPGAAAQPALPNFADLVEKHGPAVVNIRTEARAQRTQIPGLSEDDPMYEFFRRFMPPEQRQRRRAAAARRTTRARRASRAAGPCARSGWARASSSPPTATSSPTRT